MKRPALRLLWFWIAAAAGLPACSIHYNGVGSSANDARSEGAAYEAFARLRERLGDKEDVQFEGRREEAREGPAADARTLRLYGTMSGRRQQGDGLIRGIENVEQITFGTVGDDFDPDVDHKGQRLVFASTRHDANSDLYLTEIGSTSLTLIVSDPGRDEMPAFSPSGQNIAFASNRRGNWDIFVSDLDGGPPIQITTSPADEIHPSYSPDGKSIVYCVYAERAAQWKIVVMDVAHPGQVRYITDGLLPQWSPHGDKILFQRARSQVPRSFSIWTVDLVDGEARQPTEIVRCVNAAAITPTWSPDGRHIVFSTVVSPGSEQQDEGPVQADVWMVAADGTGRVNLTRSPFANLQPIWSPNGAVLFVSNRAEGSRESIWAMRTASPLQLTRDVLGEPPMPLAGEVNSAPETAIPEAENSELAATSQAAEP